MLVPLYRLYRNKLVSSVKIHVLKSFDSENHVFISVVRERFKQQVYYFVLWTCILLHKKVSETKGTKNCCLNYYNALFSLLFFCFLSRLTWLLFDSCSRQILRHNLIHHYHRHKRHAQQTYIPENFIHLTHKP